MQSKTQHMKAQNYVSLAKGAKKENVNKLAKMYLAVRSQTAGKETNKNWEIYNITKFVRRKSHSQPSLRGVADEQGNQFWHNKVFCGTSLTFRTPNNNKFIPCSKVPAILGRCFRTRCVHRWSPM